METYTEINEMRYKLENTELKKIACDYGLPWLCESISRMAVVGMGNVCGVTITPEYLLSLSANDKGIIDHVIKWECGKQLTVHTAAEHDGYPLRQWCTLEPIE